MNRLILEKVNLIDGTGATRSDVSIIIKGDRIVERRCERVYR